MLDLRALDQMGYFHLEKGIVVYNTGCTPQKDQIFGPKHQGRYIIAPLQPAGTPAEEPASQAGLGQDSGQDRNPPSQTPEIPNSEWVQQILTGQSELLGIFKRFIQLQTEPAHHDNILMDAFLALERKVDSALNRPQPRFEAIHTDFLKVITALESQQTLFHAVIEEQKRLNSKTKAMLKCMYQFGLHHNLPGMPTDEEVNSSQYTDATSSDQNPSVAPAQPEDPPVPPA